MAEPLAAALAALADPGSFQVTGQAPGACAGRALLERRPAFFAATDASLDSGAIGQAEAELLSGAIHQARGENAALVLCLDSAGARLTEGVPVLGAFRRLQGSLSAAVEAGMPVAAVLGRHCFGGASLLAGSASVRFYRQRTLFGLSGPRALGGLAGERLSPETVARVYGSASRLETDAGGVCADAGQLPQALRAWRASAEAQPPVRPQAVPFHEMEAADGADGLPPPAAARAQLDDWFGPGWRGRVAAGTLTGEGMFAGHPVVFAGFIGGGTVDVQASRRLDSVLRSLEHSAHARTVVLLLDSPGQAASIEAERPLPSLALAAVSAAAARLKARGHRLMLWLIGEAGGAVYVALAAAAHQVVGLPGTRLQTLPASAVSGVIGAGAGAPADAQACLAAGVVDCWVRHPREAPPC